MPKRDPPAEPTRRIEQARSISSIAKARRLYTGLTTPLGIERGAVERPGHGSTGRLPSIRVGNVEMVSLTNVVGTEPGALKRATAEGRG